MKKICTLVIISTLFSCSQKGASTDTVKCPDEIRKFEDPQRIHTCETFINYVKENNISAALSMTDLNHYLDPDKRRADVDENRNYIDNIKWALDKYATLPKEQWIIRCDTMHVKINFGTSITPFIVITEGIYIPLDQGKLPADSTFCIGINFNVTALESSPNLITYAILTPSRILKQPTNYNVEGFNARR